jgi:hypothetical protein
MQKLINKYLKTKKLPKWKKLSPHFFLPNLFL